MIMYDGIGRHPSRWGVNTRNSLNEMRGRPPRCSFSLGNTACPPPLQTLRRRLRDAPRVAPIKALDRRQTYLLRRTSIVFPIMRGQRLFGRSSRDSTQFRLLALPVCFHSRRPPTDMSSSSFSYDTYRVLGAQQVVCQWETLAPKSKTGHELNFQLGESDTCGSTDIEAEGNDTRYSPFAGKPR
ncbi:uncharacterized protein BDW70DRAFT_143372 [Aspergillus foveolatus]|uniref:uncharacterized protein n=1 Tax=Aspergillus foveolatus TaxID=210207 RepID=UPI003CCE1EA0